MGHGSLRLLRTRYLSMRGVTREAASRFWSGECVRGVLFFTPERTPRERAAPEPPPPNPAGTPPPEPAEATALVPLSHYRLGIT